MKTGIIILSRLSSSRLPGKALREINGKPVLRYIIERLLQVLPMSQLVIATSDEASDDPIEAFAQSQGIDCYRGSLLNVAERFYKAAAFKGWDYAARINGDNIFIDIPLLRKMVDLADEDKFDFISNVKERTYPKGMSIEIVRVQHYATLLPEISSSEYYREHVTAWLYDHDEGRNYRYVMNHEMPQMAGIQLALDTAEDFSRTEIIFSRFSDDHTRYNMPEIFTILKNLNNE